MSAPEHLLLHTCCAPCLIAPSRQLRDAGTRFSAYWSNFNIHPWTEYRNRLETLKNFAVREGFPLLVNDAYGLRAFLKEVGSEDESRCNRCYFVRLEEAAKVALEQGCDAFSTTLLYSKYQKHETIREIGERVAKQKGIHFYYQDWRPLWDEGIRMSKAEEMYRQKYCGCIFSEEERYMGSKL